MSKLGENEVSVKDISEVREILVVLMKMLSDERVPLHIRQEYLEYIGELSDREFKKFLEEKN
jgi:uncharacterized protein (UPF0147 family)